MEEGPIPNYTLERISLGEGGEKCWMYVLQKPGFLSSWYLLALAMPPGQAQRIKSVTGTVVTKWIR